MSLGRPWTPPDEAQEWWDEFIGILAVIGLAHCTAHNFVVMVENAEQRKAAAHQIVAAMFATLMSITEAGKR